MAKLSAKVVSQIREEIEIRCRIKRPGITELFLSGEFDKLPAMKGKDLETPYNRLIAKRKGDLKGWKIPKGDYGRSDTATLAVAESIRLWVKQNFGDHFDAEKIAVICEADSITLYRKA